MRLIAIRPSESSVAAEAAPEPASSSMSPASIARLLTCSRRTVPACEMPSSVSAKRFLSLSQAAERPTR